MEKDPVTLIMDTVTSMQAAFFEHLPKIVIAIAVLVVTFFVARIVRAVVTGVMHKAGTREALVTLAKNLIGIASWIIGVAIAITVMFPSVTPANLIAGLGLTSVAIGFAFKDIFENFLAGVIILGREKMRIGDFIECNDVFGQIEEIKIRETHVRETDGELAIVPNAMLFQNALIIQTDQELKRQELVVGVDYDADMKTARDALLQALRSCDTVDESDKPAEVQCVAFGGSSIDFRLLWWTNSTPKAQRTSYDQVAFAVKDALDAKEISIPFPQVTLSYRDEATMRIRDADSSGKSANANGKADARVN